MHRRELKPAIVKKTDVVKAGADEDEPSLVPGVTPETLEGYTQCLNKIILGIDKNIKFMGKDTKEIIKKAPKESEPVLEKLPK